MTRDGLASFPHAKQKACVRCNSSFSLPYTVFLLLPGDGWRLAALPVARGVTAWWFLRSLATQAFLWFYVRQKVWASSQAVCDLKGLGKKGSGWKGGGKNRREQEVRWLCAYMGGGLGRRSVRVSTAQCSEGVLQEDGVEVRKTCWSTKSS